MPEYMIVSRHPAAIAFIRDAAHWGKVPREFETAPVIEQALVTDVYGKHVAGNLPLSLAAECEVVYAIEFDGPPPRGQEYDLAAMRAAGARLRPYIVKHTPAPTPAPPEDERSAVDEYGRPRMGYFGRD